MQYELPTVRNQVALHVRRDERRMSRKVTGTGAVRDMKVSLLIPTNLSRTIEISLSDEGQTGGGARPTHHEWTSPVRAILNCVYHSRV